jgi:Zn finger protein HypA/HybF involved in hydrogenase expression
MINKFESMGIDYLENAVCEAKSFSDILRKFNYSIASGSYKVLKNTLKRNDIDYSHIPMGALANKGRVFGPQKPISDYLIEKSTCNKYLKNRLIKEGILKEQCIKCGLNNEWKSEYLSLQLDHIDGNHENNKLENLRLLCPNCHSQTPTYSGKDRKVIYRCVECNNKISNKNNKRCNSCAIHPERGLKFDITKEELEKLIWEKPTTQIAKSFNVSDKAIEKRCKKFNIEKPPRGYWKKLSNQ